MSKILSASICLRRDNEFNYDKVKDTFIPLNGEICLVDTSYGIKAKIGNGFNSYGSLPWIEEQALLGIVIQGYLKDNEFYLDNIIIIVWFIYNVKQKKIQTQFILIVF